MPGEEGSGCWAVCFVVGGALERAIPLSVGGGRFCGRYHYVRGLGKDPTCHCSWEVELLCEGW